MSAFNTVWTYDIYRVVIKKDASDERLVWMGRITTVAGVLLSVATAYLAMQFNNIMDYIQAIFSWVNAPLFATMPLGMFWKKTTPAGAFYSLVAGMLSSFFIFMGFKFNWFPPAVANLIAFTPNPSNMSRNMWQAAWTWTICFSTTVQWRRLHGQPMGGRLHRDGQRGQPDH